MTGVEWWSQRVAAEGSTASEGIRRQLGKPKLDPLTVLIREAAQNSCDAAVPGNEIVNFDVHIRALNGRRLDNWRNYLLPEPVGSSLGLAEAMDREPRILTIADRGTTGLGGPLRADEPPLEGERADFVKFIRNVGERKGVDLGGGSYGFGKGILYNVSRCHVIVADSRCMFRGKLQRRLIGAAMGDGFESRGVRYTGRHWLGVDDKGIAQALVDDEADAMAEGLGLPRFAADQTGTTIAIVDIDLGAVRQDAEEQRSPEQAAEYLASTMVWNLWPKMVEGGGDNRLRCSVKFEGFPVEIPDPAKTIELKPFVDAYRKLQKPGLHDIPERKSAPKEVGRFAKSETMAPVKPNRILAKAAPFQGGAHHCARMRQADLVVDYVVGDPHPDEMIQYAGVFKSSAEADEFFAEAEPPTHDDWVTRGLSRTALGVVRLANGFIKTNLRVAPMEVELDSANEAALAPLAGRLSGLVAGAHADGANSGAGPGGQQRGRRGGRTAQKPRIVEGPALDDDGGAVTVTAKVEFPKWASRKTVVANPLVVIDGGLEAPDTLDGPSVVGWTCVDTGDVRAGERVTISRSDPRVWSVRIAPPADAVVRLNLVVEADV